MNKRQTAFVYIVTIAVIALTYFALTATGSGTVTASERRSGSIKTVAFAWISDATGDATLTTTYTYEGEALLLATDPGSVSPTDNYDVTITDRDGIDVLAGAGADRDETTTEYVQQTSLGIINDSTMLLTIANAGSAKAGDVYIYIR